MAIQFQNSELTEYAAASSGLTTDLQQEFPMHAHRYIQTVLTHGLVEEMKQDFEAPTLQQEQQLRTEQDERAHQMVSRFAGISLTVDG